MWPRKRAIPIFRENLDDHTVTRSCAACLISESISQRGSHDWHASFDIITIRYFVDHPHSSLFRSPFASSSHGTRAFWISRQIRQTIIVYSEDGCAWIIHYGSPLLQCNGWMSERSGLAAAGRWGERVGGFTYSMIPLPVLTFLSLLNDLRTFINLASCDRGLVARFHFLLTAIVLLYIVVQNYSFYRFWECLAKILRNSVCF